MFLHSMKFDLGEDVHALQESVHRWAQERVKPMAAEIDRTIATCRRPDGGGYYRSHGIALSILVALTGRLAGGYCCCRAGG